MLGTLRRSQYDYYSSPYLNYPIYINIETEVKTENAEITRYIFVMTWVETDKHLALLDETLIQIQQNSFHKAFDGKKVLLNSLIQQNTHRFLNPEGTLYVLVTRFEMNTLQLYQFKSIYFETKQPEFVAFFDYGSNSRKTSSQVCKHHKCLLYFKLMHSMILITFCFHYIFASKYS